MKGKSTWLTLFFLLMVIHTMAAIGVLGWLRASGRLNGERIDRIVSMFSMTIEEEQQKNAQLEMEADQAKQEADRQARSLATRDGLRTFDDQLSIKELMAEKERQMANRLMADRVALERNLANVQALLAKERKVFDEQRAEFEKKLAEVRKQQQDEDFMLMVDYIQRLAPKQAKLVFQEMMTSQQGIDQVVDILAAMQPRKAGDVLGQFKQGADIAQATMLLEQLKQRGVRIFGSDDGQENI